MAKKKASRTIPVGTQIQVNEGVTVPEFPDILCEGWTGTIVDTLGKKSDPRYVIEWEDAVVDAMPEEYVSQCEQQNLFHRYACLTRDDITPSSA